jgi:hypothetical protein
MKAKELFRVPLANKKKTYIHLHQIYTNYHQQIMPTPTNYESGYNI